MNKGILIAVIVLTLLASVVLADTTTLYSKISLTPFYNTTLLKNIVYNFSLSVNPPDKLTQVFSAIVKFDLYATSSPQDFNLTINNQSCKNPIFQATQSGFATAQFDCSNIINGTGNYSIKLFSIKDTGSAVGYLELTYTNKPLASMELSGTEYLAGEDGTIFLLLKDPNGIPITNATCVLDIYYPLSANNTHSEWINDGLMRYLEEGLYYYDFIAPLYSGIYMVNAKCSYLTSGNQYYTLSSGLAPVRNSTYGTYTGDPFVLNDYGEWLYTQCDSGTAGGGNKACDVSYEWNLTAGGLSGNVSQLFVQYLGENNGANPLLMYWWNWSSSAWVLLPNNLTFHSTASSGVPIGVDEYLTNSVPISAISNLTRVRIRLLTTSGSTFKQWDNMLVLKSVQYGTSIQDLKGSGEIHISSGSQGENNFFRVNTCDGYVDGRCGIFTDDDEFDLVEGEIEDYLNISASSTRSNLPIHYETPFSVDCSAVYWVKEWNGTEWVDFTNYSVYSQPTAQDCIMTFYKDVVSGTNYQFWIKMDNYMKWEVQYTNQISHTFTNLIQPICANRNFTYTTPITNTTPISNDTITDFCHRSYDDLYWLGLYYNDSLGVDNAGVYASFLQESRFYRQELFNRYDLLSANLLVSKIDTLANLTNINLTAINNQLLNITGELVIHKNLLNQILTYLQTTIYPYLQQMWSKLLGLETQLNTTINITNQSLVLDTEINQTTHNLSNQIGNLNISMQQGFAEKDAHIQSAYDNMSSQVNNLSNNVSQNFNTTFALIDALNFSIQNQNNTEILSYLLNISQAINTTQTQISQVNQSLNQQIINTSNNTQNLINAVNSSTQARFDLIQNYLDNLTILINTNQNISQQNISALMQMLVAVNTSIATDITNLNTSLYNVRADLLSELNTTYNYLVAMNISLTNDLALINASISGAIQDFRNEAQANFSTMFSTLTQISGDLNGTKADLLDGLNNLSIQVANTNQSIQLKLDALNISIQQGFAEKDAHIQSAYDNLTSQINNLSLNWSGNFSVVLNKLDNLSNQIETNHNITQGNLSTINNYLTNLNSSIQQGFTDLNTSISLAQQNLSTQISLINASLSQSISDFRAENQANMSALFLTLNGISADLNLSRGEIANLSLQLNQTEQTLLNQMSLINTSLSSDLAWLKNDSAYMIEFLNDLNLSIGELKINISNNEALLYSIYNNLSTQMAQNTTAVLNMIISTNATLSSDISAVKNDTEAIITQIGNLNATMSGQYDNLTSYLYNLSTQIDTHHNITQANFSTLFGLMGDLNSTCNANYLALNTSIGDLRNDVYDYYIDLNATLSALNISISQAISLFQNETSANFNQTYALILNLSNDLNSTKAELKADLLNLSIQLNDTKASIIEQIGYVNDTIVAGFIEKDAHIQSVYDNLTAQIIDLNSNMTGGFSYVNSEINNLSIQIDTNHNITQTNISELKSLINDLNSSFYVGMGDLNATINQTGENIVGEITSLKNLLLSINQTLTADIIENRNQLLLINTSLSSQIGGFQLATESNFNTTFALINGLEGQNNLTHALLGNLSLQLNQTQAEIDSRIDIMNISIHNRFDTLDNNMTTIISILDNMSFGTNASIQEILESISNLSTQESNYFNITQQNISTLFLKCDGLNTTMTGYYQSLYDALAGMNITINYVNTTNNWIVEYLNISTDDLNLNVIAPNRCLVDTNWLAKAQVRDRFGNILSYLDGVECNMTTNLWGTSNMTYVFVEQNFKYIHLCDPTNTTFNWSVNCARVS